MRVDELEALLARLPGDMLVVIHSVQGCKHISEVAKRQRISAPRDFLGEARPPMLDLRASWNTPCWFEPEPPWDATGRWPGGLPTMANVLDGERRRA